jgi:hypothetical protein
MRRVLLVGLLCVAGCSGSARTETASEPASTPKAAHLEGAGRCRAATCTFHFATHATGDTQTFSFTPCARDDCPERRGRLTAGAQAQMRALAERLGQERFERGYGCPGCVDGPTYVVVIHRPDGSESSHTIDPLKPEVLPPALRDAAKLIEALVSSIGRCEASELLQLEPDCKQIMQDDESDPTRRSGIP